MLKNSRPFIEYSVVLDGKGTYFVYRALRLADVKLWL
jgi:hypothetical protein